MKTKALLSFVLLRLPAFGLVFLVLQSCSSLRPSSDGRMGLFDDLARGSDSGSSSQHIASASKSVSKNVKSSELRQEKAAQVAQKSEAKLKEAKLQWPLKHVQVTSSFGKRTRDFHEGLDLKARTGTPIFAAQAGSVIYAGSKIRGYGKMLIIKHKGGVATVYAHASKLLVHRGEKVNLGQKIAMSGKTGKVTGPHLHFEVRSGAVAVDPLEFLPHKQVAGLRTIGPIPKRELASSHD